MQKVEMEIFGATATSEKYVISQQVVLDAALMLNSYTDVLS
jgi:hypothetical protein